MVFYFILLTRFIHPFTHTFLQKLFFLCLTILPNIHTHTHSHLDGNVRGSSVFSMLPKDASACKLETPGIKPPSGYYMTSPTSCPSCPNCQSLFIFFENFFFCDYLSGIFIMLENLPCAVHQSPFHRILQYLICAQSSGFLVDAAQADLCCA